MDLVGAHVGTVHEVGHALDAGPGQGVTDEGDLTGTRLTEARGHRQDGAVVLGDAPAAVLELLDVGQVAVLVEDAR